MANAAIERAHHLAHTSTRAYVCRNKQTLRRNLQLTTNYNDNENTTGRIHVT